MNSIFIIKTIIILVQVLFLARFHLELANVNGYIEPVNTIRKITNPFVLPIKRLIPFAAVKKIAALLLAFVISAVIVYAVNQSGVGNALLTAFIMFVNTWISFLQYGMFLFVIGSWIQISALQKTNALLYALFAPMLRPIQKILPSFAGLDFSPIIFLLLLSFAASSFSSLVARLLY